ncbi:response regulator [Anaerobacillus alkalidiazotrophicus]|uniref:response regulator n=1 Tax=Anaerobacillus alkalidiazotrophicus TaxID=472963 RepID=UPI001FE0823F|nr:response regulator transcription factor [Anaerobacillus alkalidiazotrophicus]
MAKPKIMLVDDHGVLLSGIQLLLSKINEWEIIGTVSSGEEAVEKVFVWNPDLILMDISMPGIGGIEATKQIKLSHPKVKILMLTMYSEEDYFKKALKAGASGYVLKKAVDTELISAVRTVLQGETYIYPTLSSFLLKGFFGERQEDHSKKSPLSKREKQVLKYVALGFTYQEIADQLYVSVKTVETHKARISEKLNLKKRSELVRYAVAQGLISINE